MYGGNVGGVRPLLFFIRASSFKCSNHWKWHEYKNVLKWNRVLGFEFSVHSSVYGATTVAKVSLFSTWTLSTVSFYFMQPFRCTKATVKDRQANGKR